MKWFGEGVRNCYWDDLERCGKIYVKLWVKWCNLSVLLKIKIIVPLTINFLLKKPSDYCFQKTLAPHFSTQKQLPPRTPRMLFAFPNLNCSIAISANLWIFKSSEYLDTRCPQTFHPNRCQLAESKDQSERAANKSTSVRWCRRPKDQSKQIGRLANKGQKVGELWGAGRFRFALKHLSEGSAQMLGNKCDGD